MDQFTIFLFIIISIFSALLICIYILRFYFFSPSLIESYAFTDYASLINSEKNFQTMDCKKNLHNRGDVILQNLPSVKLGSKKLKHLKKREEAKHLLKTSVLLDNQKMKHEVQALEQRRLREHECDVDNFSQICEKRNNEESMYIALAEEIELMGEGYDEFSKELCISDFLSYVSSNKIVLLDDLATKFHIKTQIVAEWIIRMTELGRFEGVFDERGRFLQITKTELDNVVSFVREKGRASIVQIMTASNQIFQLLDESPSLTIS